MSCRFRSPFRIAVCAIALLGLGAAARAAAEPPHSAELDAAIIAQAKRHGVPEKLVRRIVMRESRYNARARNHSFWGLMQISYPTAKSMGFKGSPEDLLNPFVNLTYAVPYLANAFIIAGKEEDAAVRLYAAGYYNTARSRGLLSALRTADSKPLSGSQEMPQFASALTQQNAPFVTPSLAPLPQDVAAAPLPEHRPGSLPEGKKTRDSVAMVVGRSGDATPPEKWTRDGGLSLIGRGEQPVEQIAAFGQAPGIEAKSAPEAASRHAKHAKSTMFAAIYMPAAAQAYAPSQNAQDPQLAQTPAQAAIAQMGAGSAEPADGETRRVKKSHSRASRKDRTPDEADAAGDAPKSRSKRHQVKAEAVAAERPEDVKNPDAR